MARGVYLLFGALAYLIFFATFLYLIAFVGAFPGILKTVDSSNGIVGVVPALPTNLLLIAMFGVQHSVMARPAFKAGWTRIIPRPIERSMYVLLTSILLWVLFYFWQPIPTALWTATGPAGVTLLWGAFALGWAIVLVSTFLINHFELFGLKQVWMHATARAEARPVFRTPFFYRLVRHPLYSGFLLAFWSTPRMSIGHAVFAAGMTAYILIALRYEERDLIDTFGADYEAYRGKVGMLVPGLGRTR